MNKIKLVLPNFAMKEKAVDFRQEFFDIGEMVINGSYKLDMVEKYTYEEWVDIIHTNLDKEKSNPKFGTSETYFAVDDDDEIVGIINFRHTITDFYKDLGHIGYSTRPSRRCQGIATEMLRLILDKAKDKNFDSVTLVCKSSNIPSNRTIIKNGGKLNRTFGDEEIKKEYIITL